MQNQTERHPYLDAFIASLVPYQPRTAHTEDPPVPHLLPLPKASPEAARLLELLLGADHDLRDDHPRAGAVNLALAETRLHRLITRDGLTPALEAALAGIALAKEEMETGRTARALAALAGSIRAICATAPARR